MEIFNTTTWVNVAGAAVLTLLGAPLLSFGVVAVVEAAWAPGPTALMIIGVGLGVILLWAMPVAMLRSSCIRATFDPAMRMLTIRRGPPLIALPPRRYRVRRDQHVLCHSSTKRVRIDDTYREVTSHLVTLTADDDEPIPLGAPWAGRPDALEVAKRAAEAFELELLIDDHGSTEQVPYRPDLV